VRWSDLEGRRVLVLGTGREGSAVAERLAGRAELTAVDERDGDSAARWRERWGEAIPLVIGTPPAADVAIASPGIPPHAPVLAALAAAGVPVTTSTALWLAENGPRTTAVTGSKGKSTTSSLLHALSVAHGVDARLGGNIGIPLLSLPPADRYVAELSSQQAAGLRWAGGDAAPDVVVLTSLFPEHLDWHGSERAYYDAKLGLAGPGTRVVVVNGEDERLVGELGALPPGVRVEQVGPGRRWSLGEDAILRDGEPFVDRSVLALRGRHNALNACLALAALEATGVEPDAARATAVLADFRPLEHRLESIPDASGVLFVDDSLSTSPYAAIEALKAFPGEEVVLLLGGKDRGVDYAPLADWLAAHPVAALVGLPDSGPRILAEVAGGIPAVAVPDMDHAVRAARERVPAGCVGLRWRVAPSYGRYRDYADRADDFRRAIRANP